MSVETLGVQLTTPYLNPTLIAALRLAFPLQASSLRVMNVGEPRQTERCGLLNHGAIQAFGEEYELDCRYCGDTRRRMRVNHTYDPISNMARWHCYNEGCQSKPECRAQMARSIMAVWREAKHPANERRVMSVPSSSISQPRQVAGVEPALPEGTVPIKDLLSNHPAVTYLQNRGFDIDVLWDGFQIGYCEESCFPAPALGHRIVIPIVEPALRPGDSPKLIGWQARQIPGMEPDRHSDTRYLTMYGFQSGQVLYASIHGPQTDELWIVEGPPDVWRLGRRAVGLSRKSATPVQIERLVELGQFCSRIIVALDRDAETEKRQLALALKRRFEVLGVGTQVHCLPIPEPHKDVGDCNEAELMAAKTAAIAWAAVRQMDTPSPPTAPQIVAEERPQRTVTPNELAARLIENGTGTSPAPSSSYSEELRRLGMVDVFERLELPLQPVLRAIEQRGLYISHDRLRETVCNHSQLAAEAARLQRAIYRGTGRIHTDLDALGSCTGMITSRDYPLQNMSRELRKCVIAGENKKLIHTDYVTFQWRIAAASSGDQLLLSLLSQPGFDLYKAVSAAVFGSPLYRCVTKEHMMWFLFSRNRLNPSSNEEQAVSQFLAHHHRTLVGWLQEVELHGNLHGTVRTPFGRLVRLPREDNSSGVSGKAVNYLIQTTAADVFKHACINVHGAVSSWAKILLVLHDSLLVECQDFEADGVATTVARAMEAPIRGYPVRLEVKTAISDHWT